MAREYIYLGRDNKAIIKFLQDEAPLNLAATSRVVVEFSGTTITADTNVNSQLVDWSEGAGGVLKFKFGGLPLPPGEDYPATVVVYDAVNLQGQVLVHKDSIEGQDILKFRVVQ